MNLEPREDWRTLREFYPDPEMRHKVHYAFAHRFLPGYVRQNPTAFFGYLYDQSLPGGPIEPTRFVHSRWHGIFEPGAGLVPRESVDPFAPGKTVQIFRRVSDLTMSLHNVGGSRAALVQMPTPERPVEAYFICVVETGVRIITLEAVASDRHAGQGVLCEWTRNGQHSNFGFCAPANPEAFLHAVAALLQAPGTPPVASFSPGKNAPPTPNSAPTGAVQAPSERPGQSPKTNKPWWTLW